LQSLVALGWLHGLKSLFETNADRQTNTQGTHLIFIKKITYYVCSTN